MTALLRPRPVAEPDPDAASSLPDGEPSAVLYAAPAAGLWLYSLRKPRYCACRVCGHETSSLVLGCVCTADGSYRWICPGCFPQAAATLSSQALPAGDQHELPHIERAVARTSHRR